MDHKEKLAALMVIALIIFVGTQLAIALTGAVVSNEYRVAVVAWTILTVFVSTTVFGRNR